MNFSHYHKLLRNVSSPGPRYLLRLHILSWMFTKYLTEKRGKFLEIGAGSGDVSSYLSNSHPLSHVDIVETSKETAKVLTNRFVSIENITVHECALSELSGNTSYDAIFAFEVLEHIQDDITLLNDIYQHLKSGSLFFMSVPAYMRKWQAQDVASGHVRRYEISEIKEKLENCGFELLELVDYGFPLTSLLRPLRKMYYTEKGESIQEKTAMSGISKRIIGKRYTWLVYFCLSPFILLQKWFSSLHMGDGIVLVAKKN